MSDNGKQAPIADDLVTLREQLDASTQRGSALDARLTATEALLQKVLLELHQVKQAAEAPRPAAPAPEPTETRLPPLAPAATYLAAQVQETAFGIPLDRIREVIRMPAVRPLPNAPRAVDGLFDFRGAPVVVVDLRVAFGHAPRPDPVNCWTILVEIAGGTYGLKVDGLHDVVPVDAATVRRPTELEQAAYLVGLAPAPGVEGFVTLLAPDRLLSAVRADTVVALDAVREAVAAATGEE